MGFLQDWSFLAKKEFFICRTSLEKVKCKVTAFFLNFKILAENIPAREMLPHSEDPHPPQNMDLYLQPCTAALFTTFIFAPELLHHKLWQGRLLPGIPTTPSVPQL